MSIPPTDVGRDHCPVQAARMTLGGDRAAGMVYFAVYGFAFLGAAGQYIGVNLCLARLCVLAFSTWTCDAGTMLQTAQAEFN